MAASEQLRWAGLLRIWREYAAGTSAPALAAVLADCPENLIAVVLPSPTSGNGSYFDPTLCRQLQTWRREAAQMGS